MPVSRKDGERSGTRADALRADSRQSAAPTVGRHDAAGLTVTLCNLALAVITLLPMPTFGGRVWSDLASALFVVRASEPQLEELIVPGARDAMAVDVERGDIEAAIDTARQALDVAPTSPLAHSLRAFALHRAGRPDEAAGVARAALAAEMDPADREYLQRFL